MSRLKALYEATLLEHNKNPRYFEKPSMHTHHSHGVNPLCGDDYHLYLHVKENVIQKVGFVGQGCAISKSSASMMAERLVGMHLNDAILLKNAFLHLITEETTADDAKRLEKLKIFEGVRSFPVRVKCAALIWRALEDALQGQTGTITTED